MVVEVLSIIFRFGMDDIVGDIFVSLTDGRTERERRRLEKKMGFRMVMVSGDMISVYVVFCCDCCCCWLYLNRVFVCCFLIY